VLDIMTALGFQTTGWQDGKIQKTIVTTLATISADLSEVAKQVADFGFNDLATGDALNEFSNSRFGNTKTVAVRTRGPMRLRSSASIPYTIEPGQLIVATDDNIQFRNVDSDVRTLPAGGAIQLTWEAVKAGADSNVPNNTVTRLLTPLAGVTVSNDEGTPWYTVAGADEQSDASIQLENRTQWARLSIELVAEAYINIAIKNGAAKVGLNDQNPRGAGTIDVYPAAELGLLGPSTVAAIQLAFSGATFGTDATWPASGTSRVAVLQPTPFPLDLTGSIYFDPAFAQSEVQDSVNQALADLLRITPLGGFSYPPALANVITLGDLLEVIENVEGVRTAVLTTPAATVSVGTLSLVVQGTWTFTYTPVTS
jgi:hypothetical protein